ncbi:ATP-binding protein [Arthrobacter zhaoxinii]|uniref:ATP-binding protein n=1 Tax=Arthrobacter zhaoxinii TaxID=2964616 RepID=A0ABY5YPP2_9MICC|nr:ATP-binding protein [Arthrobacter zhaoxinii]UWX96903.1 ATP-binding protein [Arthrobacter zhaoxinii]
MYLYGRGEGLQRLQSNGNGFIAVTGDSGIGKSALLGELVRTDRHGWITAPVANLRSAPGQLHNSLISQLTAVLDLYLADRTAVTTALQFISEAAKRLGSVGGKEISRVVGVEILNLLKSRLGPEFGESIGNMVGNILQAGDESLQQRLASSSELGTVEIVLKFAEEIIDLTGSGIRLVLDRAERLSPGDKAILLDMAEMLPGRVQVLIGLSTATVENRAFMTRLAETGAAIFEIYPLGLESTRQWMTDTEVSALSAEDLLRITSGYPLFLAEAINALRAGHEIHSVEPAIAFQELTKTSWNQLAIPAKIAARKLAVFGESPPDDFIASILGCDQNTWSAVRDDLLHYRIFITDNEGVAWFHDRRRDVLLHSIMNTQDRDDAVLAALESLDTELESLKHIPHWTAACLSELSATGPIQGKYAHIANVGASSRDGMAVLFALLELMEPQETNRSEFIETNLLLEYASNVVGVTGDSVDGLQELENLGFASTYSKQTISITTHLIADNLTYATILGRMTREFGRWIIPSIASSLFNGYLRPLVSPFQAAGFGMGTSSLTKMARDARQASEQPRGYTSGRSGAVLAVTARLGGRPFFAGIGFQNIQDRDAAAERLAASQVQIREERLIISSMHRLPVPRLRSRRVRDIFNLLGLLDSERATPLVGPHFHLASAQHRVDALEAVRTFLTDTEAAACDLLEPRSILVDQRHAPSSIMEIYVSGIEARAELVDISEEEVSPCDDPLFGYKLSRQGQLLQGERVRGWSHKGYLEDSMPKHEPFAEVAEEVTSSIMEFNKFQEVERIPLDAPSLESSINLYRHQCIEVAQTVLTTGLGDPQALSDATGISLYVSIYPSDIDLIEGYGATCIRFPSAEPSVTVNRTEHAPTREESRDWLTGAANGLSSVVAVTWSQHPFAEDLIAELLGYDVSDIRLVDPHP